MLPLCLALSLVAQTADGLHRYALLVGANRGNAGEEKLAFAAQDARSVAAVLTELAGFRKEDTWVLEDPTDDAVRDAFARLRTTVRGRAAEGERSLLFVYYSGHADAVAMHLDGAQLRWAEMTAQAKSVGADTRLIVVDACRSGSVTHVKGVRAEPLFALPNSEPEVPQGYAVLTSASANEDAQESVALGGSFFTHYFVSALRGAGDTNGDGRVTLLEAFQYSAEQTASSTAATTAGVQHATYRYHLSGHADLAMTAPAYDGTATTLRLNDPGEYLFRAGDSEGPLALDTMVNTKPRWVWLPPGKYAVQRRTSEQIYRGTVKLRAGDRRELRAASLEPTELASLTVKGGDSRGVGEAKPMGLDLLVGAGGVGLQGLTLSTRGAVAFEWQVSPSLRLDAVLSGGRSTGQSALLRITQDDVNLAAGARVVAGGNAWLDVSIGARVGVAALEQRYSGPSALDPRWQLTPLADAVARFDIRPSDGPLRLSLEGGLRATALNLSHAGEAGHRAFFVNPILSMGAGVVF
jgi:hypothetical protein